MAYWQGESEDRPAHIAFVDTHAGEVCRHEELTSGFWDGYAIWQDNGRVLAIFNQDKDIVSGGDISTQNGGLKSPLNRV